MTKALWLTPCILALASCGTKDSSPDQGELRSDMPLRTAKYYVEHQDDLAETDAICRTWKASQRPPASWPAVVVSNCGNVDGAKSLLRNKADTDKLRKEAGI